MLPTLSKTLDPSDYDHLSDELSRVARAHTMFTGNFATDHRHRAWEYSICLAAAGTRKSLVGKKYLDVGCGYSFLGALLAWQGARVTVVDVDDHRVKQEEMGKIAVESLMGETLKGSLQFVQGSWVNNLGLGTFDFVSSISVIEHVDSDEKFFKELLAATSHGGTLVLTTDFHLSGQRQCDGHLRTYNGEMLRSFVGSAAPLGFAADGWIDYTDRGGHVNGYNFASLVLRRAL